MTLTPTQYTRTTSAQASAYGTGYSVPLRKPIRKPASARPRAKRRSRWARFRTVLFVAVTTGTASAISLIGGMGLQAVQEKVLPLIPLLIALPALNTMVGDYAAIIAAHATDPKERDKGRKELAGVVSRALWINIIGVLLLSLFLAWRRGYLFEAEFAVKFTLFIVVSMALIVTCMFGVTTALDRLLGKHRINPDDIMIPIVTSFTDVFMLGLVALAVWLVF